MVNRNREGQIQTGDSNLLRMHSICSCEVHLDLLARNGEHPAPAPGA
jgi:hypothetical protein